MVEDSEDGSRRSSMATVAEDIHDARDDELHSRHNQPPVRTGERLYHTRNSIIVGIIAILVLWVATSIGMTQFSDVVYRACQLPIVPAIASRVPMGLCDVAPLTDETFTKVLDAQARYEKIYRYVEKRASLPDKMTEAAKRADADESTFPEKDGGASDSLSPKAGFLHGADYSHAVLDLTSFLKQARETAQRLVVADKVAKSSLNALLSKKERWTFLKTAGYQKWQVVKIHDTLAETSVIQIALVIGGAEVARKKIEILEQSMHSMEKGAEPEQSPVQDIIAHLQEAHALLELVKDGAEKIRTDLREAQRSRRSIKGGSRAGAHGMALESMVVIWGGLMCRNVKLLGEALAGPRVVDVASSSKTFGTIDPLLTTTPKFRV
ncbi:hypothetical protein LQW54_006268 [Pestalotiopsis sp. IQ-011]